LHNLATLYYEQEKYERAEPLFRRALIIHEKAEGLTHPNTQGTRKWYVGLLRELGRHEEATAIETAGKLLSEEYE
jgi:hypothetical protein